MLYWLYYCQLNWCYLMCYLRAMVVEQFLGKVEKPENYLRMRNYKDIDSYPREKKTRQNRELRYLSNNLKDRARRTLW